jgi:prepilin-type processing-associated H-X9-DG protein
MIRERRGFTLNDVMAVVFVIGFGFMIWLGFVSSARESSRRTLCINNMKQIGAALQQYHATHGSFPLGVTASSNPMSQTTNGPGGGQASAETTVWSGWSPHAQMLGYLDQTALYNSVNFDFDPIVNGQEPFNTTVTRAKVPSFLCPTDPYAGNPSINSYYASIGTNVQGNAHRTTGIFGYQQFSRLQDVTDGLATTIAFAEGLSGNMKSSRYRGNGVVNFGTKFPDPDIATVERFPDQVLANLQACNVGFSGPASGPAAISGNRGQTWAWGCEAMSLFNTIVPPNSTEYPFNQCRYECNGCFLTDADHSDIVNASSYHPGGANAVFCDGGVRFIRGSMAMRTWWAMGTRNSGDVVSSDSF